MLSIAKKTSHALKMMKIATVKMVAFPTLLLLIGICVISLSLFLILFFLIQHFYFGLSVINFSTLMSVLNFPITTHFIQTVFCIISFIIGMFISVVFSYSATYVLICKGLGEEPSLSGFYRIFRQTCEELFLQSVIMTLGYIRWSLNLLSFGDKLKNLQEICNRTYVVNEGIYYDPFGILLYPLLVTKPGSFLKDLRSESADTIKKKFTSDAECQYTFSYLSYLYVIGVIAGSYCLWNYKIMEAESVFLMGLVMLVLYWSVLRLITISFAVSVYHYCVGADPVVYPSEFVTLTYKKTSVI